MDVKQPNINTNKDNESCEKIVQQSIQNINSSSKDAQKRNIQHA